MPSARSGDRAPGPDLATGFVGKVLVERCRPDRLRAGDRLAELGVDSLTRVELVGALEARIGRSLDDAEVAALAHVRDVVDRASASPA